MRHPLARCTVAAALLLLAGCGGSATRSGSDPTGTPTSSADPGAPSFSTATPDGSGSAGPGVAGDACALLSEEDIRDLTGLEVIEIRPQIEDSVYPESCQWILDGGASSVTLGLQATGGRELFDTSLKPFGEQMGDAPLVGVGDDGLVSELTGAVVAVAGDALVDVQAIVPGPDDTATATRLVERVLRNLGTS